MLAMLVNGRGSLREVLQITASSISYGGVISDIHVLQLSFLTSAICVTMSPKTVLITGANGFIGNAAARYFALQGWKTYGFIRHEASASDLRASEVIPVIGSYSDPKTWTSIQHVMFDLIISTTEDNTAYEKHFNELMALFMFISKPANSRGKKPLVLFTSGNKDYGEAGLHNAPDMKWIEEDSPLNPPSVLVPRCFTAPKVFGYPESFYAALIRPCMIYGRTGSYYTSILGQAALRDTIVMDGDPNVIWSGIHVDDVASAYFHIATKLDPPAIHGQVFTVSNDEYDTFQQLAEGLAKAYGGKQIIYQQPEKGNIARELSGFSQALKSERLRTQTGWRPVKMGFLAGLEIYKTSFDEALRQKDPAVVRLVRSYLGEDAI